MNKKTKKEETTTTDAVDAVPAPEPETHLVLAYEFRKLLLRLSCNLQVISGELEQLAEDDNTDSDQKLAEWHLFSRQEYTAMVEAARALEQCWEAFEQGYNRRSYLASLQAAKALENDES